MITMTNIQLGSKGNRVRQLQQILKSIDADLKIDGVFGHRTEKAVRLAQRRSSIFPVDGIVSESQMAILSGANDKSIVGLHLGHQSTHLKIAIANIVNPAQKRAAVLPLRIGSASNPSTMRTSQSGRLFIIARECQKGVSNRLHHPSSGSGVTVGPGYDMKEREAKDIAADLTAIGVAPDDASRAAAGAHLQGAEATKFVHDNRKVINLDEGQEAALLSHVISAYEHRVKHSITVNLYQFEFDALVSFAYNPGGGWHATAALVNHHRYADAMKIVSKQVNSHHTYMKGLADRRAREIRLFCYGEYQ